MTPSAPSPTCEPPKQHEFVTVLNRRWCLLCDLFQMWKNDRWPHTPFACSQVYARPATPPAAAGGDRDL